MIDWMNDWFICCFSGRPDLSAAADESGVKIWRELLLMNVIVICRVSCSSGRPDLNWRPPGPKPGALTGLRYAPSFNF